MCSPVTSRGPRPGLKDWPGTPRVSSGGPWDLRRCLGPATQPAPPAGSHGARPWRSRRLRRAQVGTVEVRPNVATESGLLASPACEDSQAADEGSPGGDRVTRTVIVVTVAIAVVAGSLLRSWYLFHAPSTSDEAVVGLMANAILHGHFSAFYWGQAYGGAEPYAVAGMFALFGHSDLVLRLTPVLLFGGAALLTWRATLRLVRFPRWPPLPVPWSGSRRTLRS